MAGLAGNGQPLSSTWRLMDPYDILGVSENATPDEIKQAYRREAMKWHPDRSGNSPESKERFHQAAEAYRFLSARNGHSGNGAKQAGGYREETSGASYDRDANRSRSDSEDNSADSVFWDVMLDHAIKLAQTGLGEHGITAMLTKNGCPERLAAVIAEKAFNINAHYAADKGKGKRKRGADKTTFKQERLEAELLRAFINGGNWLLSPRGTVDYYLVIFNELGQSTSFNPISWVSANRTLMRILNFSIVLFAVLTVAISFFPGPSEYKLLPDMGLLQVPFGVLALMFVWTMYRKLWLFTFVLGLVYLAVIAFFNSAMPAVLNRDLLAMLLIAATCFAPFVFVALFGNYVYYRKAQGMIRVADRLFDEQLDKLVWIKNRAGGSPTAAFMFMLLFGVSLIYYLPRNDLLSTSLSLDLVGDEIKADEEAAQKIRLQLEEASRLFEIAELNFNHSPPDFMKAEMAYSTAADNGSLLAAYKLGYMYYSGEGVRQSDALALESFQRAVNAPLAFQPHSLELTTKFLAEAYNGLGVMYQYGYGTVKNLPKAREMYLQGEGFGSANASRNLKLLYSSAAANQRIRLAEPVYD